MLRAFVGCALDPESHEKVRLVLEAMRARLVGAGVRATFTPKDNLHLTLKFLGMIDDAQVAPLDAALAKIAADHGPLRVHVTGIGAFPDERRPHVIFAAITDEDGALASLAKDVDAACVALGHAAETRPFHAHITLARVKPGVRPTLVTATPAHTDAGLAMLEGISLFKSAPGPTGSVYTPLATHKFIVRT